MGRSIDEVKGTTEGVKENLLEISSTQNVEIKGVKDRLGRVELECRDGSLWRENYFMPWRTEVNVSFRRMTEEIESYSLIRGQIVLLKEELNEVERALKIMDAKMTMLKQEFPTYREINYDPEREKEKER